MTPPETAPPPERERYLDGLHLLGVGVTAQCEDCGAVTDLEHDATPRHEAGCRHGRVR